MLDISQLCRLIQGINQSRDSFRDKHRHILTLHQLLASCYFQLQCRLSICQCSQYALSNIRNPSVGDAQKSLQSKQQINVNENSRKPLGHVAWVIGRTGSMHCKNSPMNSTCNSTENRAVRYSTFNMSMKLFHSTLQIHFTHG